MTKARWMFALTLLVACGDATTQGGATGGSQSAASGTGGGGPITPRTRTGGTGGGGVGGPDGFEDETYPLPPPTACAGAASACLPCDGCLLTSCYDELKTCEDELYTTDGARNGATCLAAIWDIARCTLTRADSAESWRQFIPQCVSSVAQWADTRAQEIFTAAVECALRAPAWPDAIDEADDAGASEDGGTLPLPAGHGTCSVECASTPEPPVCESGSDIWPDCLCAAESDAMDAGIGAPACFCPKGYAVESRAVGTFDAGTSDIVQVIVVGYGLVVCVSDGSDASL